MRREVRVIPMTRDVLNAPSLASRPKVTWTDENATKSTKSCAYKFRTKFIEKTVNCWDTLKYLSDFKTISSQALPVMA